MASSPINVSHIPLEGFNKKSRLVVYLVDICSGKKKEKEGDRKQNRTSPSKFPAL